MASNRSRRRLDVTPWFDKNEFLKVKEALFSDDITKHVWGLRKLDVWRQRSYPCLPAAIEATSSITRAKVQDQIVKEGMCPLGDVKGLSLMYTAAINEFVNHMSELGQSNTTPISMKKAALNIGCPDWLVDLRHQATHSSCPSLDVLRNGADSICNWLLDNFWNPMCDRVQPSLFIPKSSVVEEPDYSTEEEFINTYKRIQCDVIYSSLMHKKRHKSSLNRVLNLIGNRICKNSAQFFKALVRPDMFFISLFDLKGIIPGTDIDYLIHDESLTLPHSLINFWAPLIKVINSTHAMQDFVHHLLTQYLTLEKIQQKIACAWVSKIVKLAATNGSSETDTDLIGKIFLKDGWMLNWLECATDCIFNPSAYCAPIYEEVIERIFPPFSDEKRARLTTMFSICIGVIPPQFEEFSKKKNRLKAPHTWEQVRDNKDVKDIVSRNQSADLSKVKWRRAPSNINWSELPIGYVHGNSSSFVGNPPAATDENMETLISDELMEETNSNVIINMKSLIDESYDTDDEYKEGNFEIQISAPEAIIVTKDDFY